INRFNLILPSVSSLETAAFFFLYLILSLKLLLGLFPDSSSEGNFLLKFFPALSNLPEVLKVFFSSELSEAFLPLENPLGEDGCEASLRKLLRSPPAFGAAGFPPLLELDLLPLLSENCIIILKM